MKYYSDYLDKMFDDEDSCIEAERKAKAEADKKQAEHTKFLENLYNQHKEIDETTEQLSKMKEEFYHNLHDYYERFGEVPKDMERYFPLFIFF